MRIIDHGFYQQVADSGLKTSEIISYESTGFDHNDQQVAQERKAVDQLGARHARRDVRPYISTPN
jgi:hypothetical protein